MLSKQCPECYKFSESMSAGTCAWCSHTLPRRQWKPTLIDVLALLAAIVVVAVVWFGVDTGDIT